MPPGSVRGHRGLPVYLMGLLICAVILLIEDLDRPGTGLITVSQQPMIDAATSIASYAPMVAK